jgi:hypothetical protein
MKRKLTSWWSGQRVKHLPGKQEDPLSSNSSISKKEISTKQNKQEKPD